MGTCVSNLKSVALTVLELLAFNSHDRPLRTNRHTHIERIHFLRHSLRSLGGDNKLSSAKVYRMRCIECSIVYINELADLLYECLLMI